jgi:Skp family chaperone for outer membrane proteins
MYWLIRHSTDYYLAGVAAGFDELTEDLTHELHKAEAELTAKTAELEEAKAEIARLRAKLDSYEPWTSPLAWEM